MFPPERNLIRIACLALFVARCYNVSREDAPRFPATDEEVTGMPALDDVLRALRTLRVPLQRGEYDLHALVREALEHAGLHPDHEVPLAPRCRIDFLCNGVGIEVKRGRTERQRALTQLRRYAACEQITALVLVTERTLALPDELSGKPLRVICLNRLWGIAL